MGKKVLVVGQGAREHALAWKIAASPRVEKVYAAPGNPGISGIAECVDIKPDDIDGLLALARDKQIDLTVVGPEIPLMKGIVDEFEKAGMLAFGPSAAAALIEGSKVFTKDLCRKYNIPTAAYGSFSEPEPAREFVRQLFAEGKKAVVKADGLAAGKGVIVACDENEALEAVDSIMLDREFGSAGDRIVVEECLEGEELSFFVISDGQDFVPIMAAQDHKRVFDNDEGPNTGGMGAYANPPVCTIDLQNQILEQIIAPTLSAMQAEGRPYKGVLYAGLMLCADGPKVLEYNARFGDPEAQVLIPMIESDLYELLEASALGNVKDQRPEIAGGGCVCVVLASGGYPGNYPKGLPITGLDQVSADCLVFHAGTALVEGGLVTDGGRVLSVVCRADDLPSAVARVYNEVNKIRFDGVHFRRDIACRALSR